MSPGRAPPRVTGSWLRRSPSAVIATVMVSPPTTSPPTTAAPATWHSSRSPSISSAAQVTGRSAGTTRPSSSAVGTAPMAAMSARFCAAALRPTSYAVDQSRRKCRPSSRMSVLATTLRSGAATTAASSPGPSRTAGVVVSRDVSSLMSPNSPNSPTVPFTESHLSSIAPDTRPGCFSGRRSGPWADGPREPVAPGRAGIAVPPSAPVGLRSRARTAVGTVKGYVNLRGAYATLRASTGP